MSLNVKALAWAAAVLWGGMMFLVGLANLVWPTYAVGFLEWAASFYPGYAGPGGIGAVVVATGYALVDGAIAGAVLGWLYNAFAGPRV